MGVGCLLALTCVALVLSISGVGSAFRLGLFIWRFVASLVVGGLWVYCFGCFVN